MDVFIPEEYVARRRSEKKAAAMARERSDKVSESSERILDKEKSHSSALRRPESDMLMSSCLSDNVVFSCLSA